MKSSLLFYLVNAMATEDTAVEWTRALIQFESIILYQCRKSYFREKAILRPSYPHNVIPYTS